MRVPGICKRRNEGLHAQPRPVLPKEGRADALPDQVRARTHDTAFVPAEPYQQLATLGHEGAGASAWRECASPHAVGGHTIRCGMERVRLLGVDAPALHRRPNHRRSVEGDRAASRLSLQQAVSSGPVRYRTLRRGPLLPSGRGRRREEVNLNLSGCQIRLGRADYVAEWDKDRIIGRSCRPKLHRGEGGSNS